MLRRRATQGSGKFTVGVPGREETNNDKCGGPSFRSDDDGKRGTVTVALLSLKKAINDGKE
jgi:hypothetical protein